MFDMKLQARRSRSGAFVLEVPLSFRAAFAAVAAVVAGSALVSSPEATLGGFGSTVLIVSILAALYEERWTFDPAGKTVRFRFGLLFAARSLTVPFDELEGVGVELFVKGQHAETGGREDVEREEAEPTGLAAIGARLFRKKRYARLAIYRKDAPPLIVESAPAAGNAARAAALEDLGREIARVVGVPIRDRDTGNTPPDDRPRSP